MNKKRIEQVLLFIVLFIVFRPTPLNIYPAVKLMVNIAVLLIFIIFLALNIYLYKNKKKFSPVSWFLLFYLIALVFSTFYNNVSVFSALTNSLRILSIIVILEYYLKTNPKLLLQEAFLVMTVFLIINSLCLIFSYSFTTVGSPNYFLGIRTRFSDLIFPYLMISIIINHELNKNTGFLLLSIALSLFNILYVKIGTAIGGIIILSCLYFLDKKFSLLKLMTAKVVVLGSLLLNVSICFFRIQTWFSLFIEKILHKSITLTNRTFIWDKAISYLHGHWIFGLGLKDSMGTFVPHRGRNVQAHNQILQILCEGGLVALIFYIAAIFSSLTRIKKDNKIFSISISMLATILIMMTTERYGRYVYFYFVLYIIYYATEVVKSYSKKEEKNEAKS